MNILYILGNGFDINLGLPTRYRHFYHFYNYDCIDDRPHIKQLKESIYKYRKSTWADLEKGFGEYTPRIPDYQRFEEIYEDLSIQLIDFLRKIDEFPDKDYLNSPAFQTKFIHDLCKPESYLPPAYAQNIHNQLKYGSENIYIKIATFNYTHTFEHILGKKNQTSQKIGSIGSNSIFIDTEVLHIHREIGSEGIIWGVNDKTQILNETLRDDPAVQTLLIKPRTNQELGYLNDNQFRNYIANAQLICLFGTSIGETDQIWWDAIGNHLLQTKCHVIHFLFTDRKFSTDTLRVVFQNREKKELLQRFHIDKNIADNILPRIHCVTNSDMFKNMEQKYDAQYYLNKIFGRIFVTR